MKIKEIRQTIDNMPLETFRVYQKGIVFFMIVWIVIFGYFGMIKIAGAGMISGIIILGSLLFAQRYYYPDSEVTLSLTKDKGKYSEEDIKKIDQSKESMMGDEIDILPSAEDLGLPSSEEYEQRARRGLGIK